MTEISDLPPSERIKRYLGLAEHARHQANSAKDEQLRQSYLFIAEQWERLARHLAERHQIAIVINPAMKR